MHTEKREVAILPPAGGQVSPGMQWPAIVTNGPAMVASASNQSYVPNHEKTVELVWIPGSSASQRQCHAAG